MTRDEAITYIKAHPSQFKGASIETVLAKTVSSNDPNYYNPTLYVPEQAKTVVKPNTPTRGATVSYPQSKPTGGAKTSITAPPDVRQGLFAKASLPPLPTLAFMSLLALGAGIAIYRVSR